MSRDFLKRIMRSAFFALAQLALTSCVAFGSLAWNLHRESVPGRFPESESYSKSDGKVFYNSWDSQGKLFQLQLSGVDAERFKVKILADETVVGVDGQNLYLYGKLQPGIELDSFRVRNFVYREEGADNEPSKQFYSDGSHLYILSDGNFTVLDGIDPSTFERINYYWSRDKNDYYLMLKPIRTSAIDSFRILGGPWATDNEGVFLADRKVEGIDLRSFKPILGSLMYGLATDKDHVFWGGKILEGADSTSFRVITRDQAIDRFWHYYFFPFRKDKITEGEKVMYGIKD